MINHHQQKKNSSYKQSRLKKMRLHVLSENLLKKITIITASQAYLALRKSIATFPVFSAASMTDSLKKPQSVKNKPAATAASASEQGRPRTPMAPLHLFFFQSG